MKVIHKNITKKYYKDKRLKSYEISIGKTEPNIKEFKFIDDKCPVVILSQDDYNNLIMELEKLTEEHEKRLLDVHKKHSELLENKGLEFNKTINDLKEQLHEKDIILNSLNDEIHELKENHYKEIKEHLNKIRELEKTQFRKEYHMTIAEHEKKKNELKDQVLKLRLSDFNKHERLILELEDLGFFEKHTSTYTSIIKELKETNKKKLTPLTDKLLDF